MTIQPLFPLCGGQSWAGLCCSTKASLGGVWSLCPRSQPGAGDGGGRWVPLVFGGVPSLFWRVRGWQRAEVWEALLVSGSGDWSSWGEKQHVPLAGTWALLAGPVLHPRHCGGALGVDRASHNSRLPPCRGLAALTGVRHHLGGVGSDWWLAWGGQKQGTEVPAGRAS